MTLTNVQKECVDFNAGDLLVKGVAGSGKSVVILRRALKLYEESRGNSTIKIFTYTNTLVKYTRELLQDLLGDNDIEVSTVDLYFGTVYKALTRKSFFATDPKKIIEVVDETLRDHAKTSKTHHRFYNIDTSFWMEEFNWIQEKCITTRNTYLETSRHGRGSAIRINTEADKKIAWDLYELFLAKMRRKNYKSWPELYLFLNQHLDDIPNSFKVDFVFVDEAQDMTLGKMRALKAIARKSITIAADMSQKIYKTTFTWREAGIDIQGRASKSLKRTFRSTKQIITLAEDLNAVNRRNVDLKGELTDFVLPESEGPKPRLYVFENRLKEETYLLSALKNYTKRNKDDSIGLICRTRNDFYHYRKLLQTQGIPYQEVIHERKYRPEWQLLTPGIKLVVSHSSKGLEFDTVFIPDVDEHYYPFIPRKLDDEQRNEYIATERNVLYVCMTRARAALYMFCTAKGKSRFINEFSEAHYDRFDL